MIYIQRQEAPQFFWDIPLRRRHLELMRAWLKAAEEARLAPPHTAPQYDAFPAVLRSISQEFLNKCAFCEQQLNESERRLTFFRPLRQALQKPERNGGIPDPHHYAWLIGDWSNLYLTCEICGIKQGS